MCGAVPVAAEAARRREPFVGVIHRAVRRGELLRSTDVDAVADALIGAVILRYVFRGVAVDGAALKSLIRQCVPDGR